MTVETDPNKTVDIRTDKDVAYAWAALRAAQQRVDDATSELDRAREIFDRLVGDREAITADGLPVAVYRHDGRFSAKKFTEDLPHIADKYTRWEAKPFIDEKTLKSDHPGLYEQYRARTLRITKDGR